MKLAFISHVLAVCFVFPFSLSSEYLRWRKRQVWELPCWFTHDDRSQYLAASVCLWWRVYRRSRRKVYKWVVRIGPFHIEKTNPPITKKPIGWPTSPPLLIIACLMTVVQYVPSIIWFVSHNDILGLILSQHGGCWMALSLCVMGVCGFHRINDTVSLLRWCSCWRGTGESIWATSIQKLIHKYNTDHSTQKTARSRQLSNDHVPYRESRGFSTQWQSL